MDLAMSAGMADFFLAMASFWVSSWARSVPTAQHSTAPGASQSDIMIQCMPHVALGRLHNHSHKQHGGMKLL